MPEINFQTVKAYLHDRARASFDPVYLIFGEEYLYEQVAKDLVNAILPDPVGQKHHYEIVNHREDGQLTDVIERMNTYSFFSEKKIIELRDAAIFVNRQNQGDLWQKVKQLYDSNDFEKAAKKFLDLLGRLQIALSDISDPAMADKLDLGDDSAMGADWMKKLAEYCVDRKLPVPEAADDAERLKNAIERGFPKNHFLLITTDTIDKRKGLYKTIANLGTVIDCSIAKGNRKADVDAQKNFLQQHMRKVLQKRSKEIQPRAFELIFEMTGFNLRAFTVNLEKLVDYAKERDTITIEDVQAVLVRTRQDPIYELTGAIADRDILKSLHYMSSLLFSGFHYLQILTAITNQVRKLLLIHGFIESQYGADWHPKISFDQFKSRIIPLIGKYDDEVTRQIAVYRDAVKGNFEPSDNTKKKKTATDLVIAATPNNPYPIFLQFAKSRNYTKEELFAAFEILNRADVKLKTSGQAPSAVLEEAVFKICGKF